jgi:hypothetical protein
MDDVNWDSSIKNITWTIVNPDPKFKTDLYIDPNTSTGTTRGTCLVRYPNWTVLPIGNYIFTLQADVIDNNGNKISYSKQVTVTY